jgi:ABC-2 type transport system permease protein
MGCVAAFASSLAEERQKGTLMRLATAPISRGQVLMGKALACFTSCLGVQGLLAIVMKFAGVEMARPHVLVIMMIVCAIAFTGVMMALSGLAKTETGAGGLGRAVLLVLALVGGGSVPLFFLPEWVRTLASVSPFAWSVTAIEGATWRNFSMTELLRPTGVLLGFGAVGLVIGLVALRRQGA